MIRRRALSRAHRRRASQRECRKTGIADRIHLPRSVVSKKVEQLVLDDRTAHAASELLLLMNWLRIVAERFLKRIQSVQRRIAQIIKQVAVYRIGSRLRHRVYDS